VGLNGGRSNGFEEEGEDVELRLDWARLGSNWEVISY